MLFDCVVIGGGIVGLSVALNVLKEQPGLRLVVLEKEPEFGKHQTGHNSGVIHSGIYYKPGSYKAKFASDGNRSMVEFCREYGLPHDVCGKVIVATEERELPLLDDLFQRGLRNGLDVSWLSPGQVNEIEPHVRCRAGIRVPSTGIVNYNQVCAKVIQLVEVQGGILKTHTHVKRIRDLAASTVVETNRGDFITRFLINCAGLHSDRIASQGKVDLKAKIVPFRGEYYELLPERRHLVNSLIYPVPNPNFPFLGVHFTRMMDGTVHAGPNAVLALKREGYRKGDFSVRDFAETMTYSGFWKLTAKHWKEGAMEIYRSASKAAFVRSLQKLIPEVQSRDLVPVQSGVRAQALKRDGTMVDDFLILHGRNSLHVCNAPSPAATAAFEIGKAVAATLPRLSTVAVAPSVTASPV